MLLRSAARPGQAVLVLGNLGMFWAGVLDLVEPVGLGNADRAILPGSYVDVELSIKVPPLVEIPAEALVVRADKAQVAVIDAEGRVRYKPVVVADDDGQTVRLARGLDDGVRVAMNLGGDAEEGSPVQVVESPKTR